MKKAELVFLEALTGAKTQKQIAEKLEISLSTVNNALKVWERIGALEKKQFGFKIIDREKALMHWASARNLQKDIIYKTRIEASVKEIEKLMPSNASFTAFTAFKLKFRQVPSDYSEVYAYAGSEELEEIMKRFPERKGPSNLFILKKEKNIKGKTVQDEVLFVDLWNLKEWYAKEFIKALKKEMRLDYEG
jgi:predicted transcriptional regulator